MAQRDDERERVSRLLLEAIESLPEPDRRLVLEHVIGCALVAPRRQAVGGARGGALPYPAVYGPTPCAIPPGATSRSVADVMRMPEEALRAALHDTASSSRASEPTPSILRLLAEGRTRAQVASELGISEDQVSEELERPRPLAARLLEALRTRLAEQGSAARESAINRLRTAGPAGQQLVPVRFPEEQHARLKEWCARNGFSMAVVIRGLVDRFLDEYDPREA